MNRKTTVRLELAALGILVAILVIKAMIGPEKPKGVVAMGRIDVHELEHDAFELNEAAVVTIEAVGSIESARSSLAEPLSYVAYAWIIRRDDRRVVWRMDEKNTTRDHGLLVTAADTIMLEPGLYDAYFAPYGNSLYSRNDVSLLSRIFDPQQHWQNDEGDWRFAIRPLEQHNGIIRRPDNTSEEALEPQPQGLIWSAAPVKGDQSLSQLVDVRSPVDLQVYALGEIGTENSDYACIEDVVNGRRVWQMTEENTTYAGGTIQNRLFDGKVHLEPGVYRFAYRTDALHDFSSWRANPPYDPYGWGVTISAVDPAEAQNVSAFDVWEQRTPLIAINKVPDSNMRSAQFTVSEPVSVVISSVGEINDAGRYDYAWLQDDLNNEPVWEMTRENSQAAGGASKNRQVTSFLHLDPGTYTLYYQTDDSHAYGEWNAGPPDFPERWGVTLFPLNPSMKGAVHMLGPVRIVNGDRGEHGEWRGRRERMVAPIPPPPPPVGERVLLSQTRLRNEVDLNETFSLERAAKVRVYALGEITPRGRYDWGSIEWLNTGETVWEMTWQNTHPAGGDDRNRRFVGIVTLQPGDYKVHFETDFSHAFGDFDKGPPPDGEYWGITISEP